MSDALQKYLCRVRRRSHASLLTTVTIEAQDFEEALRRLHADGYLLISAEALLAGGVRKKIPFPGEHFDVDLAVLPEIPRAIPVIGAKKKFSLMLLPRVSTRELISFAIQLSALLQAGIPLLKSIQIVKKGTSNRFFESILDSSIKHVSGGASLSYAIGEHPKVFPSVWGNLIKVGETSGKLPEVLREIAHYQESAQRVKSKVISAFFYPSILILFATCAVGFLLLKIIPQFETMFEGLKIELPLITKGVILASKILRHYFLIVLALIVAVIVGVIFANRTPPGKFIFDTVRIKMPLMGSLVLHVSIVRFARALSTLIRSGVPILQGLEISSRLASNAVVEDVIDRAHEGVRSGQGLGTQIEASGLFPVFMTQLVSVGEESGELARFLDLIANYYEERIDTFLSRLTTLLEPFLLIIVGSIIGVLVVSMILPIIEISTGVHA